VKRVTVRSRRHTQPCQAPRHGQPFDSCPTRNAEWRSGVGDFVVLNIPGLLRILWGKLLISMKNFEKNAPPYLAVRDVVSQLRDISELSHV
jgi:hypothetical protein